MPTAVLDLATLEKLLSAAVAAPSIHNTQPWRFRLGPDPVTLEIRAAAGRTLRHTDPAGRALHVSVGCALLNLRIAVAHGGWEPVTRLLPRPGEPDLLATVRIGGPVRFPFTARLYDAVWRRHSSRLPFSGRPLPTALLAELTETAQAEGALLSLPGPAESDRLLRLTWEAEQRNRADSARAVESRRWVREPDGSALGVPPDAIGPQDYHDCVPMRDFGAHRRPAILPARSFEARPLLAVLSTPHDRRTDWLRAGQALERVLLVATAHGVRTSLLHQALEWPDLRAELVRVPDDGRVHAQMLIRLGYGPAGPASPRRPAHRLLERHDPEG
ncbi:Acg family FMN-binding oxidoreductase [Streptomyces sp. NPDC090493]|uniref:Acg family FMN-binding oxidoreductase n=1 Tax=Streptomyces sp. NPDC090493 TaxID=3365964 RepID=UPI0038125A60